MHTLGLNVLIIAKVWLCFILGFNPNLSVAFITPHDLLLLKLHPDPELQKQDIILWCNLQFLVPPKAIMFFFLPFVVFDYLPFRDSQVGYPSKPRAKDMINLENLSISLSSKGFERENKYIYIFYLFCFPSAGIYLRRKQTVSYKK